MASKQDPSAHSRGGKPRRKRNRLCGLWRSNKSPVTAMTEPRFTKFEQSSTNDFKPSSSKPKESRQDALSSQRSSLAAHQTQNLLPQMVDGVNQDSATNEDGSHSPSLWMRAYKALEDRHPDLVSDYVHYLDDPLKSEATPTQQVLSPKLNEAIIEKLLQDIKAKDLVAHLATKSVKVREQGEKIVNFILWSDGIISAAVSAQPYAALAWSGVSVLLYLLLNSSKQKEAMMTGLNSITDLLRLYKIKEDLYLKDVDRPARPEFVNAIVAVYTDIFEYQATLILYLSRGSLKRGIRSTFERDDWSGMMERVQNSDAKCAEYVTLSDKTREGELYNEQSLQMKRSRKFQKRVLEMLEAAHDERQQNRRDDKEAGLLQTLASDYKSDIDSIPERIPGTCEWVFRDKGFKQWRDTKKSSLLWISAGPGCGKSVLSRCLIDENRLCTNVMTSTVCYFFFKDGQAQRSTGSNAISAILHQLFRRTCGSSLLNHGLSSQKNFGDKLKTSFSELWDILIKSAGDPEAGEVVCVLDALDECEETARIQLVKKLVDLFSNPGHLGNSSLTLKFLITSRPYEDLERHFRPISSVDTFTRIDEDEISEQIGQEIHLVIDAKVSGIAGDFSAEERQSISDNLKGRNSQNYLWLVLTTDIIEKSRSKYGKVSSINGLLSDLPSSVSDAYEKILSKSSDQENAKILLQIVVAARRPLNLEEANIALSIATQTASCNSHESIELWPSSSFKSTVRSMCGLFISIHYSKLFLIHQTAREFLLPHKDKEMSHPTSPEKWKGSLDLTRSHGIISQICLQYLNLQDFSSVPQKRLNQSSDAQSLKERYPFLTYAAKEWPTHYNYQDSGLAQSSRETALKLCRKSLPQLSYWSPIYGKSEDLAFSDNWTELGIASHTGLVHVIEDLLSEGKDVNDFNGEAGEHGTALTVASTKGHEKTVEILLNKNADINAQSGYYGTALIAAAARGRETIVKILLEQNADVNAKSGHFGSALIAASARGHERIVKVLLEENADVNVKCGYYRTALIAIAAYGRENEKIVQMLLHRNADVGVQSGIFGTALIAAASRGHARIAEMLLHENADVTVECGFDDAALIAAAGEGHEKIVEMLLNQNANLDAQLGRALVAAAAKGHKNVVETLLTQQAVVNGKGGGNGTALIEASAGGYEKIVEMLLERNADVNAESENYGTALTAAAAKGHERLVEMLLKNNADVNAESRRYGTALAAAAAEGHEKVVDILLDRNAIAGQNELLERASAEGHEKVVEVLFKRNADIDFEGETYRNAILKACSNLHVGSVEVLLNKMIDSNVDVEAYGTTLELALNAAAGADEEKVEDPSENEEKNLSNKNRDMMIKILKERKREHSARNA